MFWAVAIFGEVGITVFMVTWWSSKVPNSIHCVNCTFSCQCCDVETGARRRYRKRITNMIHIETVGLQVCTAKALIKETITETHT